MIHLTPRGKLLLTAEYFVLDGVPALAVPTRLGQIFSVAPAPSTAEHDLYWRAYDHAGACWFSRTFNRAEWATAPAAGEDPAVRIPQLLAAAEALRPGCTAAINGLEVTTRLEFDRRWGLGSSSTLVAALARWLDVNPYALLARTFGGSGYDLACAFAPGPLLYERNGTAPVVTDLDWRPEWTGSSYFVYRNQKQNSRAGIRAYRARTIVGSVRDEVGHLTTALLSPTLHPRAAAQIFTDHERLVGETLGLEPVRDELFPDFPGAIKSLGAWGGDFVWALSEQPAEKVGAYFNERGFPVVIPYGELIA